MATRESKIVYSESGTQQTTARVISLTQALDTQTRKQRELVALMPKSTAGIGLVGSVSQSASAKITSLTNTIGPLGAGLGAIARSANPAAQGLLAWASAAEKASTVSRIMNATLNAGVIGSIAAGAVLTAYADDVLRAADSYSTLHARIRTFSDGQIAAAQNERAIYQASKDSRVAVADLTTLYTRLAPAVKDYGRSQQDALTITQLTSKALAIQGADVREQAAATVQFSQAIASGVLRGDELRSLLESSPQLLRYVAQNLEVNGKVGVAFSSLRKLGEAGALTTDKLISALLKAQPAIERDFINAPKTAQQGWIVMKDEITRVIGTLDKTVGGQKAVVDWLGRMSSEAEAWRQKMLLDPHALDGLKQAGDFVGGAVGSIATLGKVAAENFDMIVSAGEAVLALKLGSVISTWFVAAAQASRGAIADLQEFQKTARFQAGAVQQPVLAQAAVAARSGAVAADITATDRAAAADLAKARATGVRSAADKAAAVAEAARRTEAEAQTRAQAALAKVETDVGRDVAAAQRLKGEAAEIRARLEEDAARRSAAAAKSANAAAASGDLSKAGIGTAGTYYARLAQQDAKQAMLLTDEQRAQQLARLREIEVAEGRAAATVAAAEERKAVAVTVAEAEIASARTATVARATAEAEASALVAAAERAETQAKGANVAATNAAAAAATRNAVAQEAEALVSANVTRSMVFQQVAMKTLTGLYNLLGGGIGIATLAIGGLIWAFIEADKAVKAHYSALRDTVDITDRLRAATDSMAAATWAEIPGILAKTKALRDQAAAQEKVIATQLRTKEAELAAVKEQLKSPGTGEAAQGLLNAAARLEREVTALSGIAGGAKVRASAAQDSAYRDGIIAAAKEKADAQSQITRGTDAAGRPLTADRKDQLQSVVDAKTKYLQAQVDKVTADIAIVDAKIKTANAQDRVGLGSLRTQLGKTLADASEGLLSGAPGTPTTVTPKAKKVAVPGGVSAAYEDLLKSGFLNLTGGKGFAASDGKVTLNGQQVSARSEDEATALAKYVRVVESLNDATDAQLKKKADQLGVSVKSREELKLAAGAMLAQELATSTAARAGERWSDIQDEIEGKSRAVTKAEKDLADMIRDGLQPKQADVDKYKAWIAAKEKAAKLAEQLQLAQPVVQRGFENALAGTVKPTDSRGVVDQVAAVRQVEDAKAAVLLDAQRAVDEEIERRRKTGQVNEVELQRQRADMLAGYQVAAEIEAQDKIVEIKRQALQESAQAAEQQAQESADAIVGALKDVTFGGDLADVGKRLGMDLLSAIYDELLGNPLRLLIKNAIHDLMSSPAAGSGGGLWKRLLNVGISAAKSFGPAGATPGVSIGPGTSLAADGRIPGFADGRMDGPIFRGRGGPRGDDNVVRISDEEAIINAKSTRIYSRILREINEGTYNPYPNMRYLDAPGHASGYMPTSAPMSHMPATSVTRREGDVILNNNTGQAMTATRNTDRDGNTHIDLRPLADQMAGSAGRSGALRRGLDQSPRPTKRA
ncbi:tape measure protein [Caulobacter sp. Root343]|uniref:tape measure protein n=1 Tax=Caulobacter sp. Root343 TaxID=1736520 RepID=UPI0006FCB7A6|nr:tape measure protein [Caulobacter sp. Root343]KQV66642.1 hypothetical protein ASC70_12475 [Caulobacter sp. Root343]